MIITSIYIGLDDKKTGLEVAILVMSAGFLGLEALQIYVLRSKYLSSVWNWMDILFFVLTITTMALMLGGLSNDLARSWLFSMVLMLGYVRWMAYLRLFDAPSKKFFSKENLLIHSFRNIDQSHVDYFGGYVGLFDDYLAYCSGLLADFHGV